MVNPERETITVARPGAGDQAIRDELIWEPRTSAPPLVVRLTEVFDR
jgi:hypothetical protein